MASAAARQRDQRKRNKEQGLVDIRIDVPTKLRDRIRELATSNSKTMKELIVETLQDKFTN